MKGKKDAENYVMRSCMLRALHQTYLGHPVGVLHKQDMQSEWGH